MQIFKYSLEIIVFIVGACVLILEVAGVRVMAPYFGTSIAVWTSLIGVILTSLSIGYWWGGKIADKNPNYQVLVLIILVSAVSVGLVALVKELVLNVIQVLISDIRLGSVFAASILFAPPSILMGMVSPYAARLRIREVKRSGSVVGSLYAISTLGSIVGTFVCGFFLLSYFGNTKVLILVAALLFVVALIFQFRAFWGVKIGIGIFLVLVLTSANISKVRQEAKGFVDVDTQYNRAWVYEQKIDGRAARVLRIDPQAAQSAIFLESDDLVFEYTKYFRLASHFVPDFKRVLLIGGAGNSVTRDFLARFEKVYVDIIEIDPGLTKLAKEYFRLEEDARLSLVHEDGRTYLNRVKNGDYEVIIIDAYGASLSIPYQLTTREAVLMISKGLSEDGIVMANIVSAIEGEKGQFLRAEYRTFRSVFPQVYILPVGFPDEPEKVQNLILLAFKSLEPPIFISKELEFSGYLAHLWSKKIDEDLPILTDDFAPVDQYLLKLL